MFLTSIGLHNPIKSNQLKATDWQTNVSVMLLYSFWMLCILLVVALPDPQCWPLCLLCVVLLPTCPLSWQGILPTGCCLFRELRGIPPLVALIVSCLE